MKIRNEWMTNNQYFGEDYENNLLLNSAKERFEIQLNSLEGATGKVDGASEDFVVQNHANALNKFKGDKYIHCKETSNIHTGSIVDYENEKWLVTSDILNNQAYKSGIIQKCNSTLTLTTSITKEDTGKTDSLGRPIYTETPKTDSWDCVADTKYINADFDQAINLPEGKIYIQVPYSASIKEDMDFEMWGNKYKITGFDMSKVIGGVGTLGVHCERVVS